MPAKRAEGTSTLLVRSNNAALDNSERALAVDTDRETDRPLAPLSWAERLKRVFKLDIELCPKCGGRLRVIAAITQPDVIQKILDHVHQQQAPPRLPPSRVNGPITSEIQFDSI